MDIQFFSKNLHLAVAHKEKILKKLERLDRHLESVGRCALEVGEQGKIATERFFAEINLQIPKGELIRAVSKAHDLTLAVEKAVSKVLRQLEKKKP